MSRGLGDLQRSIKKIMHIMATDRPYVLLSDLYELWAMGNGGEISEAQKRNLRRALKGLVDRGDVLIPRGEGRPGNPYLYTTVEIFAGLFTDEKKPLTDTAKAKQMTAEIMAEMRAASASFQAAMAKREKEED
jgi:hypothetical protein